MKAVLLLLAVLLGPPALEAQLKLFALQQGAEQAVGEFYQMGTVAAGEYIDAAFRVRNTTTSKVWLQGLNVAGFRFSFASLPTLPVEVVPGGGVDFMVRFAPLDFGPHSAYLNINGVRTTLMATALASAALSRLDEGLKTTLVSGASIDFGSVERGAQALRRFQLENLTGEAVTVQTISVSGAAFRLSTALPTPITLKPQGSVQFEIVFAPLAAGQQQGALQMDGRWYTLLGIGKEANVPKPQIVISPEALRGAQQAKVSVQLASQSKAAATGELSMEFKAGVPGNAKDPAVQFPASGSRTISLTVAAGDDVARFGGQPSTEFQTGTTAGSIVFTVKLGSYTEQFSTVVPSAPVVVDTALASRAASGIDVQVTGFDTSRSISVLSFTFFDLYGRMVAPGMIQVDASRPFLDYFERSQVGSMFKLRLVFPVQGDSSQIGAVDVELSNSLGNTRTGHIQIK